MNRKKYGVLRWIWVLLMVTACGTASPVVPTASATQPPTEAPVSIVNATLEGIICIDADYSGHCNTGEGVANVTFDTAYQFGETVSVRSVTTDAAGGYGYTIQGTDFREFQIKIPKIEGACSISADVLLSWTGNNVVYRYDLVYTQCESPSVIG